MVDSSVSETASHGAARADTAQRKEKRQQFIHELLTALPIHRVTVMVAFRVGQIDGENQSKRLAPSTRRSFDRRHENHRADGLLDCEFSSSTGSRAFGVAGSFC
jgi:hypothetical protein